MANVPQAASQPQSDTARQQAEDRDRPIVETTLEGIWVVDAKNRTTFVNVALATMLGYTVEEMHGRTLFDFLDEQGVRDAEEEIARRRAGVSERVSVRLRRADGTMLETLLSTNPLLDESGAYAGSLAMVLDVSDRIEQEEQRRSLEEQLRQSHKLEAIGRLAGGIAHDFSNLLLGIRGYAELALRRLERGEADAADDIGEILAAADRASELTRQLLTFARRQVRQPQVLDLRHIVRQMEKPLRRLLGDRIELDTVLPQAPVLVDADRGELEQVITNLAVNARDAMPDGGRFTIEVSSVGGDEAVLMIADNGCGMEEDVAARVFEPFFTTKVENGTGLGLATVHGIVTQSGGRIALDSEPGRGTTFSIRLPLSVGTPAPRPPTVPEPVGGSETILVVEDHPMVRSLVTRTLSERGYVVIAADGGEAALTAAEQSDRPIDLVVSDLVMPGLGGRQVASRIRSVQPRAKVLYMSGYTDDPAIRRGDFEPASAFIPKPFGSDALLRRVREVLDGTPP